MIPCNLVGGFHGLEGICYLSFQSRNILHSIITTDDQRSDFTTVKTSLLDGVFIIFYTLSTFMSFQKNFSQKCINVLISDWGIFVLLSLSCCYMN